MSEETKLILAKLDHLDNHMSELDTRVTKLDEHMSELDTKVGKLDEHMSELDTKVIKLDEHVSELDTKVTKLDERMSQVETKVLDVQLTLENETNRNIRIVAEGHLDLSRRLDEALRVENEKEIMNIRVNSIENEIRRIKENAYV